MPALMPALMLALMGQKGDQYSQKVSNTPNPAVQLSWQSGLLSSGCLASHSSVQVPQVNQPACLSLFFRPSQKLGSTYYHLLTPPLQRKLGSTYVLPADLDTVKSTTT